MRRWRSSVGSGRNESVRAGSGFNESAEDEEIYQRFVRVVGLPANGGGLRSEHEAGEEPAELPMRQVTGQTFRVQGSESGRTRPGRTGAEVDRSARDIGGQGAEAVDQGAVQVDTPAVAADASGRLGNGHIALAGFDPGRRGVRALAAVAAVVVVLAGLATWLTRPRGQPVQPPVAAPASNGPSRTAAPSAVMVVVAVAGRVQRPGLMHLGEGARVADAVEAAGGALPGTDLSTLNMARKVVDGETIFVGVAPPSGYSQAQGPEPGDGAGPGGKVNLNTASQSQLQTLPGVGPVMAQRILDHRGKHGPFRSVSDLKQVSGFGNARFEQVKDLVTV